MSSEVQSEVLAPERRPRVGQQAARLIASAMSQERAVKYREDPAFRAEVNAQLRAKKVAQREKAKARERRKNTDDTRRSKDG